jgi:hypothetical protein
MSGRQGAGTSTWRWRNEPPGRRAGDAEYSYPTPYRIALVAKAREVTRRVTERHGHARFSSRDPLSMLNKILLSHRT